MTALPPDGFLPPEISVVIVTWNSSRVVADCLAALHDRPPARPWEVIVVDNASTDGTAGVVRRAAPWARLIENRANRGLPAANNQGIVAAAARYVLIANPDAVVQPGAVDALVDVLERRPRAAFAVPRLVHPDGSLQVSAGDLPTLPGALLGRQFERRRHRDEGFWWDGWSHDEERRIGRGHEACYLVRRDAIVDVGPQDEGFFLDWEGMDWTARMRDRGWEVWFTPAAEVVHVGGESIRQVPLRWIVNSHLGMYRYFAKRSSPVVRPVLAVTILFRGLMKVFAAWVGLAGYDQGLRGS